MRTSIDKIAKEILKDSRASRIVFGQIFYQIKSKKLKFLLSGARLTIIPKLKHRIRLLTVAFKGTITKWQGIKTYGLHQGSKGQEAQEAGEEPLSKILIYCLR